MSIKIEQRTPNIEYRAHHLLTTDFVEGDRVDGPNNVVELWLPFKTTYRSKNISIRILRLLRNSALCLCFSRGSAMNGFGNLFNLIARLVKNGADAVDAATKRALIRADHQICSMVTLRPKHINRDEDRRERKDCLRPICNLSFSICRCWIA